MYLIKRPKIKTLTFGDKSLIGCTFQAEKFRSDGTITYSGPVFSNTILNTGLDLLVSTSLGVGRSAGSSGQFVNVGTSSIVPDVSQSGLQQYLASTSNIFNYSGGYSTDPPIHRWRQGVFEFAIGSCTGNLTEVGLSAAANASYFNRQLFKDEFGNPTTITVLEDEGLRITAKKYFYSDIQMGETVAGSFLLNGTDTIATTRELTNNTTWLTNTGGLYNYHLLVRFTGHANLHRLSTSPTSFTGTTPNSSANLSYTAGDYYRDTECVWNAGKFVGDINSITFQIAQENGDQYDTREFTAFRLNPVIPVLDTEEMKITFRRSWGRYVA